MSPHSRQVTLHAQSNARAWHIRIENLLLAGELDAVETLYIRECQHNRAYWQSLALSHLAAEE